MFAVKDLQAIQEKNRSMICLGLDLDPKRIPTANAKSIKGIFDFACAIIDATHDKVCAYKPNLAFYENMGTDGLSLLKQVVNRIPDNIPIILDAKRGDIGNTAAQYAESLFEGLRATWVTVNPYMGYDSLRPFLEYKDRGVFVLCLTSNPGSKDFQLLDVGGKPLYQVVAEKVAYWNNYNNCGLVVGATQPEQLKEIRSIAQDMPLLIPGVGAQGGSLEKAVLYGTDNMKKTAVINVSRSVLYASRESNFAERARAELVKLCEIVNAVRSRGNQLDVPPPPPSRPESEQSNEQSNVGQQQSPVPPSDNQPAPPQIQPRPDNQPSHTDQSPQQGHPTTDQPQTPDTPPPPPPPPGHQQDHNGHADGHGDQNRHD